jgi:isopentenyldiphosphate isomerase
MDISDDYIRLIVESYAEYLPMFPDGRIDYSKSDTAPVLTVFVFAKSSLLLLRRSTKVRTYKSKWNTIAGYIDEIKPLKTKINEELKEEIGISQEIIQSYFFGEPYSFTDSIAGYTWIVHPAKVILKVKPSITLDWEHTEYEWIKPQDINIYDTVPKLHESLDRILSDC